MNGLETVLACLLGAVSVALLFVFVALIRLRAAKPTDGSGQ